MIKRVHRESIAWHSTYLWEARKTTGGRTALRAKEGDSRIPGRRFPLRVRDAEVKFIHVERVQGKEPNRRSERTET